MQVLSLESGKLGCKQPALAFNVLPMAPCLGRMEINHPPSPLWMLLSSLVYWERRVPAAAPETWTNEKSSLGLDFYKLHI
jgi:hypothetical protein